jgi:hypothetical protein
MTDNKIMLLPSKEAFEKTPRKVILSTYLVGWKQENGVIFVEKNRFNGKTGFYTQLGWDNLTQQTVEFFKLYYKGNN